jgi:hypothetical protein
MLVADLKIVKGKVTNAGALKPLNVQRIETLIANGTNDAEIEAYMKGILDGTLNTNGTPRVVAKSVKDAVKDTLQVSINGIHLRGDDVIFSFTRHEYAAPEVASFNKSYWDKASAGILWSLKRRYETLLAASAEFAKLTAIDQANTVEPAFKPLFVEVVIENSVAGETTYTTDKGTFNHTKSNLRFKSIINSSPNGAIYKALGQEFQAAETLKREQAAAISSAVNANNIAKVSMSLIQQQVDAYTGTTGLTRAEAADAVNMTVAELMTAVNAMFSK